MRREVALAWDFSSSFGEATLSFGVAFASLPTMSKVGAYLVTGAGSGIGQAIAKKVAEAGHHVFGLGRDPKKLEVTAKLLPPSQFSSASIDLTQPEACTRGFAEIRRWLEIHSLPLLGVVNNAGVFDRVSFTNSSDALWQRQFDNNLLSGVRLTREFFNELKAAAPSSVLNISSTLGLRPVADTVAYSAIKAAQVNWTKGLALEWAPFGIRANCICPGLVDTPIHGFHKAAEDDPTRLAAHKMQPLGRMGTPEDVAHAAWFLLSPDSAWTTGAVLSVDGGIGL